MLRDRTGSPAVAMRAALPHWLLTIAVLLVGCAQAPTSPMGPAPLAAGTHILTLTHDGNSRGYRVHVPTTSAPATGYPVMLAFHGGGGSARQFQETSGIAQLGDREGFLAVFPDGIGVLGLNTWNAGNCCGRAMDLDTDDVGFVRLVLDDLTRRVSVNPRRVYATGHSNGGMMSYRLAVELSDRIAAIAPVAGAMNLDPSTPARGVPLLHIHSVDDPRALYDGGEGPPFPGTNRTVVHRPVETVLATWQTTNGCPATATLGRTLSGGTPGPNANQTATELRWEPCTSGAPVVHWRLTVAGHGWPGQVHGVLHTSIIGPSTTLLDAAQEAWQFVRGFQLP